MKKSQALQKQIVQQKAVKLAVVPPQSAVTPNYTEVVTTYNVSINVVEVDPEVIEDFIGFAEGKFGDVTMLDRFHFTFMLPFETEVEAKKAGRSIRRFFKAQESTVHISYVISSEKPQEEFLDDDDEAKVYMEEQRAEWVAVGRHYASLLEVMKLTKAEVARRIGCSPTSVSSFLAGRPMRLAKIIQSSLDLLFEIHNMKQPEGVR